MRVSFKPKPYPNQTLPSVNLPISKSLANRHAVLWHLSGKTFPNHLFDLNIPLDVRSLLHAFQSNPNETIHLGQGGTTFRFFLATCLLAKSPLRLEVAERLKQRPHHALFQALQSLGLRCKLDWPLRIEPPITLGNKVVLDAQSSSQFASALLLVAPFLPEGLELQLIGKPASPSYLNLTLQVLKRWEVHLEQNDMAFLVAKGCKPPNAFPTEADWSSAIYPVMLAALRNQPMHLHGLQADSGQPDESLRKILPWIGSSWDGFSLWKPTQGRFDALLFNAFDCPDLVPGLVVCLLMRGVPFSISGLETLPGKESNRIEALAKAAHAAGRPLTVQGFRMQWNGQGNQVKGQFLKLSAEGDHRLAMAFTGFAHRFAQVELDGAQEVVKSFPDFWQQIHPFLNFTSKIHPGVE